MINQNLRYGFFVTGFAMPLISEMRDMGTSSVLDQILPVFPLPGILLLVSSSRRLPGLSPGITGRITRTHRVAVGNAYLHQREQNMQPYGCGSLSETGPTTGIS
jgi:hypothetical protein